jgi:hypothetical protein
MNKLISIVGAVLVAALLHLVPGSAAHASGTWYWQCDSQPLTEFWEEEIAGNDLSGRGTVCATPLGLWSTMKVRGLTAGNAYTVWWVYIDDRDSCANFPLTPANSPVPFDEPVGYAGPCGLADFFTEDTDNMGNTFLNPLAVFGRMDAVVAGSKHHTRFAGDMRSFKPSPGSQIWMFIFGHGPAADSDNRHLARQLLTPEDPGTGAPHLGIEGRAYGYPAGVVVIDIP